MCDCIFCKIINGSIPSVKLYQDEKCMVILDRFPSSVGHTLVIPKNHSLDITEICDEDYAYLMKIAARISKRLIKKLGCDGINILQNNKEIAGQTVFHTHIHLIPRFKDDRVDIKWENKDVEISDLENFALDFSKEDFK